MTIVRLLTRWLFPGGAIAAVTVALLTSGHEGAGPLAHTLVDIYAPVAYGAAMVLAVVFHRSRVLALVCAIGLVEVAVRTGFLEASSAPPLGAGLAVLLGVGVWARDRGVTSVVGWVHLVFGVGATATGIAAVRFDADLLAPLRSPGEPGSWLEGATGFPDPVLVFAAIGFVLTAFAVQRRRGPVERAAFWSVAMMVAGAHPGLGEVGAALLRMAAGLTLGLAVLETSYAMAYRDELTGLPARRSLMRDLDGLTGTYTLSMVDVDHFKKFNDRHGHDVGDQVLRMVASRLARAPGGGRAYRYGGEEFTLLFRGLDRDEAAPHLEAVRASVASARFALRTWSRPATNEAGKARRGAEKKGGGKTRRRKREARKLSVTVSIGLADSTGGDGGPEAVMKKADKALYRAKRAGRDRVSR